MRKFDPFIAEMVQRKPWCSPRQRAALAVVLGLALAPIVFESSALCASRWVAMYGQLSTPHTPVLDLLGKGLAELSSAFSLTFRRTFFNLPWKAQMVIPLTIAWAFLGSLFMLRKRY